MEKKKSYYYRIYDDKEEKNYFKTILPRTRIEKLIKDFEKKHQEYINSEFIKFIKKYDADAEFIKINNVFY
ncbi:MAG TPA: hypothetical protein PK397_07015 [Ignavibacteriaceae bacterium]|jgi:hypothetical protein|nr:hypothetical protein [Ignavibacteriaceae bacterium]